MKVVDAVRRYHRQVHGGQQRTLVWFRVHVPRRRLWGDGDAEPVVLDDAALERLATGLRVEGLVTAVAPPPRPASAVERSYMGLASLLRSSSQSLVGVPDDAAARMPWACAACGVLATRLDAPPPGLRPRGPVPLTVDALPGWMVGTDVYGVPMVLHLPPGTTTLLRGGSPGSAGRLAGTIRPSGRVPGRDVDITATAEEWRAAWHPQRSRVVVDSADPVHPDVVVDLDDGTVTCAGVSVDVTLLPLRSE